MIKIIFPDRVDHPFQDSVRCIFDFESTPMKEYFYEVHVSWKEKRMGSIHSPGAPVLEILSPDIPMPEQKNRWTPEQLLAASLSSCFMRAFMERAEQTGVNLCDYRSQCFIKMGRKEKHGSYIPIAILLQPVITLSTVTDRANANRCMEEAEDVCALITLLNIPVDVHPQLEYQANAKGQKTNSNV